MPNLDLSNVYVDLPVIGARGRSLKKSLVAAATGGRIAGADGTTVVRALDGVTLSIRSGDRLGLIGHNGAGKTTLLRVLAGAYSPTSGTLEINGSVTALIDLMLGMDMEATGEENVMLRFLIMGKKPSEARALAPSIADFCELGDYFQLPVRTYSSGMMLRLAFAISTSIEPEILLMDEWLSAGDSSFVSKAQARMRQLVDRAHILVIASHNVGLLQSLCNRLVTLEHGRVVADERIESPASVSQAA